MLSMKGFVFLEEIIMNMITRRSWAAAAVQALTISVAIDFSYNLLIHIDVDS